MPATLEGGQGPGPVLVGMPSRFKRWAILGSDTLLARMVAIRSMTDCSAWLDLCPTPSESSVDPWGMRPETRSLRADLPRSAGLGCSSCGRG